MIKISNLYFSQDKRKSEIKCPYCGYKIAKPYPKDNLCPRCKKFLAILFDLTTEKEEKPVPKEFEPKKKTLSSKLGTKVRVKEQPLTISLESDKIKLNC